MAKYIEAKRPHFIKWLEQKKSTLADALLMINGIYCNQPASVSRIEYIKKIIADEKQKPANEGLPLAVQQMLDPNPKYSKISKVFSLINQNKIETLKKSDQFAVSKEPDFLQHERSTDSKILMETTIEPMAFVLAILGYKQMVPNELEIAFWIVRNAPTSSETFDPREKRTVYESLYVFIRGRFPKYDPNASKNKDTAIFVKIMQNEGLQISPATAKRMFDKAFRIAEEELDPKNKSL